MSEAKLKSVPHRLHIMVANGEVPLHSHKCGFISSTGHSKDTITLGSFWRGVSSALNGILLDYIKMLS